MHTLHNTLGVRMCTRNDRLVYSDQTVYRGRMNNRAVAYVRVSTEEQATEGVSLEAQIASVRAYAQLRGLELVEVVVDAGVSAGKPLASRAGGQTVLELVRSKRVGAVIAIKLDRLFRNASDCLAVTGVWDRAGVALHLIDLGGQAIDTSTAMGRFFLTVMAGAAEMERNLISERTRTALRFKQTKDERTGGIPYGCTLADDGVHLDSNAAEVRTLEMIRSLHYIGGLSIRAIAAELNAQGIAARGTRWHHTTVARLLKAA